MIEGRLIICLGSSWDYDPTSKHQIMKRLAGRNEILWINYHGSRKPSLTGVDVKDSWNALRRVAGGLTRINGSMSQLTPLVIPGAKHPLLQSINEKLVTTQIQRAVHKINRHRKLPIQVWSFAPDVPFLVNAFDEECFIYYCVDEFSLFDGFDRQHIITVENELIDKADLVITSANALYESRRTRRDDIEIVLHGVDFDHFASAWRKSLPVPAELKDIPHPIFGFFGLIHHWVDLELLAEIARRRPQYSFVIIGDCKVNVDRLRELDNVYLLGRKPYAELPAYCAAFDAGLMFFRQTAMTRNVNPIKMYEYLAAGLPVISTPLPEAQRFADAIMIADGVDAYLDACDTITACLPHHSRIVRSRCVRDQDWSVKVEKLSHIVMSRLADQIEEKSKPAEEVLRKHTSATKMVDVKPLT